mgnify:CR=1 FL=1
MVRAVGFEAESQGAAAVTCVDICCDTLLKNKDILRSNAAIIRMNVRLFLKQSLGNRNAVDIIFMDPVWADHTLLDECLAMILSSESPLVDGGVCLIEHDQSWQVPKAFTPYIRKISRYGNTFLTVFLNQHRLANDE